jgi:SAM-dependent methyltransferase
MKTASPGRARRRLRSRGPWILLAGLFLADAWRLRARARALAVATAALETDGGTPTTAAESGTADLEYACLTARGVDVDGPTLQAACRYARAHGLDVLDLVPGDLANEQALDLLRQVDPTTYTSNPLAPGRGPRQATVVHRTVLSRAGLKGSEELDADTYVLTIAELKKFAPTRNGLAVAPGLAAGNDALAPQRAGLVAYYGKLAPVAAARPLAQLGVLGLGIVLAPPWGLAALAAYGAQPYLVTAGTGLRPRDRTPLGALRRPFRRAGDAVELLGSTQAKMSQLAAVEEQTAEQLRVEYRVLLDGGIDRFFEARRESCPLCGGVKLEERVRTTDLLQCKPGTFVLDECHSCGHIFQNPRLTPEGLDFYYRDFYDGAGIDPTEFVWTANDRSYRGRVDLVRAWTTPKRWLDVGAGHGHFCLLASTLLPDTAFEALDMGEGLLTAEKHGWIERAHLGMFPDLADALPRTFDVVSMHHYLEHTRDPFAELDAAATVLEPGGWLLIEVPNPECVFGRWFGPLWGPWFQPQHQHFVSARNLADALARRGFAVVAEERGPAHIPTDLAFTTLLFANKVAGPPRRPWHEPAGTAARARRAVCFAALAPLAVPAFVLDQVIAPVVRSRPGGPNSYRILAQRA